MGPVIHSIRLGLYTYSPRNNHKKPWYDQPQHLVKKPNKNIRLRQTQTQTHYLYKIRQTQTDGFQSLVLLKGTNTFLLFSLPHFPFATVWLWLLTEKNNGLKVFHLKGNKGTKRLHTQNKGTLQNMLPAFQKNLFTSLCFPHLVFPIRASYLVVKSKWLHCRGIRIFCRNEICRKAILLDWSVADQLSWQQKSALASKIAKFQPKALCC